jgi:hypothetical protein
MVLGLGVFFLRPEITGLIVGENITENITLPIENITLLENVTLPVKNVTVAPVNISKAEELIQGQAEINKPVKWIKKIRLNETVNNLTVKLPQNISNVKVRKIINGLKEEVREDKLKVRESMEIKPIKESLITGYVAKDVQQTKEEIELIIEDTVKEIEIEYETEAPKVIEKEINERKKEITIYSDIHYENILVYTTIAEVRKDSIKLFRTTNGIREVTNIIDYADENNNGLVDKISWIVPSLSNESYEIIVITKAEHLDANREFISDIYEQVKSLDDVWSEEIPSEHYVRVTFEQNLTSNRDITIYPRIVSGEPKIEVYEIDSTDLIAEFDSINSNTYNKVYLTNLQSESQNVFDLRVVDGSVEIDYIVDPITRGATITTVATSSAPGAEVIAHTVDADTTLLVLAIQLEAHQSLSVEPYWNTTEAFTLIYATTSSNTDGDMRNYIYGLVSPTAGSHSITYTVTGGDCGVGTAVNYLGTINSSVEDATNFVSVQLNGNSASQTVNLASGGSSGNTLFAAACFRGGDGDPATNGEGFAELADSATGTSTSSDISFYVADLIGGAPSGIIVDWTGTASDECVGQLIEILPYAPPADTNYPQFSSPTEYPSEPTTYSFGQKYEFNSTITSTNGTAGLDFNYTNYTASNLTASLFNYTFSDLAAGNYTYYWWAYGNGSSTNYNTSITYSYNISKAVPQGSISGISPINYGAAGNVEGSETNNGNGDVQYKLFKNNVEVSNPDTTILGAGTYNYIYNATGGQNYTDNSSIGTFELTVDQVTSSVNLTLNNTQANITITQGTAIDLNCSTLTGDSGAYLALYREGSLINNGTSPIGNTTTFNTIQVENITCYYQETQNYTISSKTWWVNVTEVVNQAPTITDISDVPDQSITEASVSYVEFSVLASDKNGVDNLNDASLNATFSKAGETTRFNLSCSWISDINTTTANYTCSIGLWYWDTAGTWDVNATILDLSSAQSPAYSETFTLLETTGMVMSPTSLEWPSLTTKSTDTLSFNNITINNTANKDLTQINVTAVNLQGESILSDYLLAANFTISWQNLCNVGDIMANNTSVTITTANITAGNLTAGQANETLWFCLEEVTKGINPQSYSTSNTSNWEVRVN